MVKIIIQFFGQNNHFRKHDLVILERKTLHLIPALECASGTDSLDLNIAVWIYWGNLLKIHLTINSTATVGSFRNVCRHECSNVEMLVDVANVSKIHIIM